MPCPPEEICYLCGQKMFMTSIGYGGEETRIDWKCKCGALTTTLGGKECKMTATKAVMEKKLCIYCKHYTDILMNCKKAPRGKSPVDGRMRYESASIQREYPSWWIWRCGKKGRFWESKE